MISFDALKKVFNNLKQEKPFPRLSNWIEWNNTVGQQFPINNIPEELKQKNSKKIHDLKETIYAYLFPTLESLELEPNKSRWSIILGIFNHPDYSIEWKNDFLDMLLLSPQHIEALFIFIEHFDLKISDLSTRVLSFRRKARTDTRDLPLPPELEDFQKIKNSRDSLKETFDSELWNDLAFLSPMPKENKTIGNNGEDDDNLSADGEEDSPAYLSTLLDEKSTLLIQFMIRQGFLDFSILMRKMFDRKIESFPEDRIRRVPVAKESFDAWLNQWKETCDIMDDMLTNQAWEERKKGVSTKQKAIRRIVRYGFLTSYECIAFARYCYNDPDERHHFLIGTEVRLTKMSLEISDFLMDFIEALPEDITAIDLTGHTFNDTEFSVIITALERFKNLKEIEFDDTIETVNKQSSLREFFKKFPSIKFCLNKIDNTEESYYTKTVDFLLSQQSINLVILGITADEERRLFNLNIQKIYAQQETININLSKWMFMDAVIQSLSTPRMKSKKIIISCNAYYLDDCNQLRTFLLSLRSLTNLHALYLIDTKATQGSERLTILNENRKLMQRKNPQLIFSLVTTRPEETENRYLPSNILITKPNETMASAVRYAEQHLDEKPDFVPENPLSQEALEPSFSDYSSSVSQTSEDALNTEDKLFLGDMLRLSDMKKSFKLLKEDNSSEETAAEIQKAKKHARDFFNQVIVPIYHERERLAEKLTKKCKPESTSSEKDKEILAHRIKFLSGFLDQQGDNLQAFEKSIFDENARNRNPFKEKPEVILVNQLKQDLISYFHHNPVARCFFSTQKKPRPEFRLNGTYLQERVPAYLDEIPIFNADSLDQARKAGKQFMKRLVGSLVILPAAVITWITFGYVNALQPTYGRFFLTRTKEALLNVQQATKSLCKN